MASIYDDLGVRRGINARGNQTLLGGSTPPPEVRAAMDEANSSFVVMEELLTKSGDFIADTLGTEGAFVTSGAAAAIALSSAAVLAGDDPDRMGRIPDTSGMKNEFIFQKCQDYSYKRCFTIPGAKLVEVGDENGCTAAQIEDAIGPDTAAIAFFENGVWGDNVVPLAQCREIADRHGIALLVDAAGQIYPLEQFTRVARTGDVVAFGAKYFGSPHSTGIIAGKRQFIDSAFAQNFLGFELAGLKGLPRPFGRPFKVDRQEVVGVVAALKRWFSMDHEQRIAMEDAKRGVIRDTLAGIDGVSTRIPSEPPIGPNMPVYIFVDEQKAGKNAYDVIAEMESGDPPIWVRTNDGGKSVTVNTQTLSDEEVQTVATRLREVLGK